MRFKRVDQSSGVTTKIGVLCYGQGLLHSILPGVGQRARVILQKAKTINASTKTLRIRQANDKGLLGCS